MFDFDWSKLAFMGMIALIFIPAKDLPRVLRQVGQMVGKMRRMASEFQGQFMDAIKEADVQGIRDDLNKIHQSTKFSVDYDPKRNVIPEIGKPVDAVPVIPVVNVDLPPLPDVGAPAITTASLATEPPKPAAKVRVMVKKTLEGEASVAAPRKRAAKPAPAEEGQA